MKNTPNSDDSDVWSEWLLQGRSAGDTDHEVIVQSMTAAYADRVIDGAFLRPRMRLLDIGSGQGLVSFRAVERTGPDLHVTLSDISAPLLRRAEAIAKSKGINTQCAFVECSAENLKPIKDKSMDAVVTRSSLAYVSDKAAAFRECYRVLRPGGRLSIGEPIFRDDALTTLALANRIKLGNLIGIEEVLPLIHRWRAAQFPDTSEKIQANSLTNYSERDLLRFAQLAGFEELHLELHISIIKSIRTSWVSFLKSSPHPLAPSLHAIMTNQFTAEEKKALELAIRPSVENPNSVSTDRMAYLTAYKPQTF